jgi:glycosyltransferase involved in cell wall biosynthesis
MRILFITHYFEPDSGAAAVRLSRLARLLLQRGHQVTVLTTMPHYPQGRIAEGYRGKFSLVEERDGLRIVRAWLWATPSAKISRRLISQITFMMTAFLRGLRLPHPDVIFIEAQPIFTSLAGTILSHLKRVPYVLNVSDIWPEYLLAIGAMTEKHLLFRMFRALVNSNERGAAGIVALYPPIVANIEKRIGSVENIRVIYNAVDLTRFRPRLDTTEFRKKYDLGDKRLVSFVGTFGTHIDFETLLAVAAHFNGREDVRFVFIGTGGQRETIRQRLEGGDLSNVCWIGWIDHGEMPLAWCASYITYWAIHNHELYRSILQSKMYEAMACGVPLAIATEGITSEMVERSQSGLTVPFGDVQGFIHIIERLLDDEAFHRQCSLAGHAYAEANFKPDNVVQAYEDVLTAAIQRR